MGLLNAFRRTSGSESRPSGKERAANDRDFAALRDAICPYLKRTKVSQPVAHTKQMSGSAQLFQATTSEYRPVVKPFVGEFTIEFAHRVGDVGGVEVVQQHHLLAWEMSEFQLEQLARNNLVRFTAELPEPERVDDLIVIASDSPFTASVLLVDAFWEPIEQRSPLGIVACAPSQNMIVAANASDTESLHRMHSLCANVYTRSEYRLSNVALLRRTGVWVPFIQ